MVYRPHRCTSQSPCGDVRPVAHCEGCDRPLSGANAEAPMLEVKYATWGPHDEGSTHWCKPCAVQQLPAAALPKEWRPDPADGPSHVWLGDLSGFTVESEDAAPYGPRTLLHHRCRWVKELGSDGDYLANVVQAAMEHRATGCRTADA